MKIINNIQVHDFWEPKSYKSQNEDDENKRHGCIIDFSNYDTSRII